jgi:hypothetical protein
MSKKTLLFILALLFIVVYEWGGVMLDSAQPFFDGVKEWASPSKPEQKEAEGESFFNDPMGVSTRLNQAKKNRYDDEPDTVEE